MAPRRRAEVDLVALRTSGDRTRGPVGPVGASRITQRLGSDRTPYVLSGSAVASWLSVPEEWAND